MKIQIHVTHDQMHHLLEPKAFDKYNESPMQVRMVFADSAYYFEVYDWYTNHSYEICTTVQSLNKFFLEVNDDERHACKDE